MITQEIESLWRETERGLNKVSQMGGMSINRSSVQAIKTIKNVITGLEKLYNLSKSTDEENCAWVKLSSLRNWQEKIGAVLQETETSSPTLDDLSDVQIELCNIIVEYEVEHEKQ